MNNKKIILFGLILAVFAGLCFADQFVVKSFKAVPNDLTARRQVVYDLNNKACSMIKVKTDIKEELSFNSEYGLQADVHKENPGEYQLYLSPDDRQLKLMAANFESKSIAFETYLSLESKMVYELVVKSDKNTKKTIPVTIISTPMDAEKWINGKNYGKGNLFKIPEGTYSLVLKKEKYKSVSMEIEVGLDNNLFQDIELQELDVMPYTIKSVPDKAKIYFDGEFSYKETNSGGYLYPGKYKLRLVKEDYVDYETVIEISQDRENYFEFVLKKYASILKINVEPSEAKVSINDVLYDPGEIELQPGSYVVFAVLDHYVSSEPEIIEMDVSDVIEKNISLVKNSGMLSLEIYPEDVRIIINNQEYVDRSFIELRPGTYRLSLSKEGYYPVNEVIDVHLGQTHKKTVKLKKITGKFQFNVKPIDTEVKLFRDYKLVAKWTGITYLKDLPVGSYTVTCQAPGKESLSKDIMIDENKITNMRIDFEGRRPKIKISNTLEVTYVKEDEKAKSKGFSLNNIFNIFSKSDEK